MRRRTVILSAAVAVIAIAPALVVRGDDPTGKPQSPEIPMVPAGPVGPAAPGGRAFLKLVAQPTGKGNATIRIGQGAARSLNLNLDQVEADQTRYADELAQATEVVTSRGRQLIRGPRSKSLPKMEVMKLQTGREEQLYPFYGLPPLAPAEEALITKNCLMITDTGVVEDAERTTGTGPWTFGALMTNLANRGATGIDPAEFTRRWLKTWEDDQTVNSFTVKNRKAGIKKLITDPWQAASGGDGKPLDLTKAPFRLLAIASRLDLRDNLVLGAERIGGGGAGEARFVFCAYDVTSASQPVLFTVIFEYQVKRKNFHDVREWAEQWYTLKDLPLGSTRYKAALQRITDQFAGPGTDPESPPNRSSLSQLRTNEIALDFAAGWEVREFRLDTHNGGYLREVTTKQTPDEPFNGSAALAAYINGSRADILAQEHSVPVEFPPGKAFLSGSALTPPDTFWNAPGIAQPEARHLMSLGTCSGCHAREAFPKFVPDDLTVDQPPPHFTHVRPRAVGHEARLSPFLTGKDGAGKPYVLADPLDATKKRTFGDLPSRAHDLVGLVRYGVVYEKERLPIQMVH